MVPKPTDAEKDISGSLCGISSILEEQAFLEARSKSVDLEWLELESGMSVLDVGCGTGGITRRIAQAVWPGRVVGLDASPSHLEFAARQAYLERIENLECILGDACAPQLPLGLFDVVVSHTVLMHLNDPLQALVHQRELIRKGGLVAALSEGDWSTWSASPRSNFLEQAVNALFALIRLRGGDPEIGGKLAVFFQKAGFQDVKMSDASDGLTRISGMNLVKGPYLALLLGILNQAAQVGLIDFSEVNLISVGVRRWSESPDAILIWPRTFRAKGRYEERQRSFTMPGELFDQQDLDILNRVLPHYPHVLDVINVVKQVAQKGTYPIASFHDLAEVLGGGQASVTFEGQNFRLADVERLIPVYYFPIANEHDLVAKIADLLARRPQPPVLPPRPLVGQPLIGQPIPPRRFSANVSRPPNLSIDDVVREVGPFPGQGKLLDTSQ